MIERENIVIGNGFASTLKVADCLRHNQSVIWVSGTGADFQPPVPQFQSSSATAWLGELCHHFGIDAGPFTSGNFLRMQKTKGFKEASADESVWHPEEQFIFLKDEGRFSELSLLEIEEALRLKCLSHELTVRIEAAPVTSLKKSDVGVLATLADGREFLGKKAFLFDLPQSLPHVENTPHAQDWILKEVPHVSALQVRFTHDPAFFEGMAESFWLTLTKEQEDKHPKNTFGFFTRSGKESLWTILLSDEEVLDNHLLTKRLRRLKQSLSKAFVSDDGKDVTSTITSERFRVEENVLLSKMHPFADVSEKRKKEFFASEVFIYPDCRGASTALEVVARGSVPQCDAVQAQGMVTEIISQAASETA